MPTNINGTTGVDKVDFSEIATGTPNNTNFLRGDGAWDSPAGALQLLREDIITTSGNWTVASGFNADDTVMIFLFGAGGSGGAARLSSTNVHGLALGGGGAAGMIITTRYGDVPTSTFTLTVGAGGASRSATTDGAIASGSSGDGGATIFANATISLEILCLGGAGGFAATSSTTQDAQGLPSRNVYITNKFHSRRVINMSSSSPTVNMESMGLGTISANYIGNGAASDSERSGIVNEQIRFRSYPYHAIAGAGGSSARQGATNWASYNAVLPGIVGTGGAGSGTANGANATGIGSGGGGSCRPAGTTATSGAGAPGGMVVRYYRGAVSPFQILGR